MKVDLSPIKRVTSLGKTKQNKTKQKKSPPLFPLKSTIIDIGKKKKKKAKTNNKMCFSGGRLTSSYNIYMYSWSAFSSVV